MTSVRRGLRAVGLLIALLSVALRAGAADDGSIGGTVFDPLGSTVAGAQIVLVRDGQPIKQSTSDGKGQFVFDAMASGRYQVVVSAAGFSTRTSAPVFVGDSRRSVVDVALTIGPLQQAIVVTAEATEVPVSQIGAQITVIDAATLAALGKPDLLEALRVVPGAQVVQAGGRGGVASLFVRGGASNFNKVLIDGVPANDIGGGFDFAGLSMTGVDRVEVLRESNSVLYGSDSLSGVVSVMTRRGRTRIPEVSYSIDGGNLSTIRHDASIGGASGRFDYFSAYSYFKSDNDIPNNKYKNGTYAGRFSAVLGHGTDLTGTIRRADTKYGSPNAFDFYAIADDSQQNGNSTYGAVAARSQINDRWQSTIRFASMAQNTEFSNPSPTGTPFDPFGSGANYLGKNVTITGANGYSVTGQAILDFGCNYPLLSTNHTTRNAISGQTSYRAAPLLTISSGGRFEREEGFTQSGVDPRSQSERNSGGVFGEARVTAGRLFVTGGVGYEHNAVFDHAVSPRVSVALYLRNPSASSADDTKVTFNAGKGIKSPSIYQELNALAGLLTPAQAASLGVGPVGPERATNLDVGIEQRMVRGRLRVRATYFHNTFRDLLEFLSKSGLVQAGVTPAAANATEFGAYVNSQSTTGNGLELSADAAMGAAFRVSASYTCLDAEVTRALSASASSNPLFPGLQIGAFSPLVGNRPFGRPKNSGNLLVSYAMGPAQVALAGYFSGTRDDSTFLSDRFFGNSLLLPNQDLDKGYAKVDLSGSYRIHRSLKWYATIENLLDQKYEGASGFPALPATFRSGVSVLFGGDSANP